MRRRLRSSRKSKGNGMSRAGLKRPCSEDELLESSEPPTKISKVGASDQQPMEVEDVTAAKISAAALSYKVSCLASTPPIESAPTAQNGTTPITKSKVPPQYKVRLARSGNNNKSLPLPPAVTPPKDANYAKALSPDMLVVEEQVQLSPVHVERFTGKGGDMIGNLVARAGCEMTLNESSASITIRGNRETVDFCKELVTAMCYQNAPKKSLSFLDKLAALSSRLVSSINHFFHARTGPEACVLGGWMRIAYAFLFIMDRLLWSLELDYFFYQGGVLPTRMTRTYSYVEPSTHVTIFQLAPESDWLVWAVNYLCLLQAILLLLGIAPRFQLVCLITWLTSWEHQNDHAWDSQDVMLRFFGFLLCFLPLHRLTIFEWINSHCMSENEKKEFHTNDSWPMWPFRLWQIEICFIYAGAGLSKLSDASWQSGMAVYYATFTNHFGGVFTPDVLFNHILPLKLMCWGSLFVECACWILVWPLCTRIPSLVSVVLLHVGIDLSMNMNIFEWLSILGWIPFLVRPSDEQESTLEESNGGPQSRHSRTSPSQMRWRRTIVNVFITTFLIVYGCQTFPINFVERMAPTALQAPVQTFKDLSWHVQDVSAPWLRRFGIRQHTWAMFSGKDSYNLYEQYEAIITFKNDTVATWWSPDWSNMSWLERKRNRRRQLYFNNLKSFAVEEGESIVGQMHLCEWIARPYGDDVVSVQLVYHWCESPDPSPDLGWFDDIPRDQMTTTKETHYLFYPKKACDMWVGHGQCESNAPFMLRNCAESCKNQYDEVEDVKVGSRVLVFWNADGKFYPGQVLEMRDESPKRFYIEWGHLNKTEKEWFDLGSHFFTLSNEDEDDGECGS